MTTFKIHILTTQCKVPTNGLRTCIYVVDSENSCNILANHRLVTSGWAWLKLCPPPPLGTHRSKKREFGNFFCVTQGATSQLLANLEKEKELFHIFLSESP